MRITPLFLTHFFACVLALSVVRGDEALVWKFNNASAHDAVGELRSVNGPQSPEFPGFSDSNRALRFSGRERVLIPSREALKFSRGESITIDAWIAPQRVKDSSPRYVIGKGRTGNKGFRRDNQNWAMRITPKGRDYQLSFLFATPNGDQNVRWHRWTSTKTVRAGDGWHHVAVAYRFGEPKSIRGWIDGNAVNGQWDMAGQTTASPIVDEDEIWIGSAQRGNPSNSFVGAIDQVTVSRQLRSDDWIRNRYQRDDSIPRPSTEPKASMPEFGELGGKVHYLIREGLPAADRWPDKFDREGSNLACTWLSDSFLLPRLPAHFDDWGIRSAYRANALLTIAADVELPTGPQRFLMRCRSLGRLWIDGKLVAQTPASLKNAPSGEEPITPLAKPPHPGVRVKGYRQQEVMAEHTINSNSKTKRCRVVMELMVGGKNRRIETGEICVAIETPDGKSFEVLSSDRNATWSLDEAAATRHLARIEADLLEFENEERRRLAASHDEFWDQRHQLAREWIERNPPPRVPQSEFTEHPIDSFLNAKIQQARVELKSDGGTTITSDFHTKVFPILREHCFRCHAKAAKGGLRLDSRAGMLAGGESGWAAVEPGDAGSSELVLRLQSEDPDQRMPPDGPRLSDREVRVLVDWIESGATWPKEPIDPASLVPTEQLDDSAFLRRLSLDTLGVPPREEDTRAFLNDLRLEERSRVIKRWIDRLLNDDRVADHLMADWLDMLAENPALLNKSLNSTGPFRFFLYDSFIDRKPIDRMVTELIMMRGDTHTGGSAGFAVAGENDVPMAAKAHVLAGAFLGIELGCARCHDAPFHRATQSDLFSMAAMLSRKAVAVPDTSRVPDAFFDAQPRQSLIEVTLASGAKVQPKWTLGRLSGELSGLELNGLVRWQEDTRERLAARITTNPRFAAVIVNRIWSRLIGEGIVASLHDWEHDSPSHDELLRWLSAEFVSSGYDIRHVMRLILTSDLYGRGAVDTAVHNDPSRRFFASPIQRRLTAEQVVDSLYATTGSAMDCEELTFVHDGRRALSNRLTLGRPTRAWMMATLNNERDRPSLSLPKARAIVDVLQAFGWSGSRQRPIHKRTIDANVLQPGVLANGVLVQSLSRASFNSTLAEIAVVAESPSNLVDTLFLRFLSRYPSDEERNFFLRQLQDGFDDRILPENARVAPVAPETLPLVHWFNHLRPRSNEIQLEQERRVRSGPPADPRLESAWRERYEDVVWSLINHDEFVWMP